MATPTSENAPAGATNGGNSQTTNTLAPREKFRKAAEIYLGRGWAILPLAPPVLGDPETGKRPVLPDWPNVRLTAEDLPRFWGDETPPHNLGILTGEPSRLVVLDFDKGASFRTWRAVHPDVKTRIIERDRAEPGRCHLYFVLPEGQAAPASTKGDGWDFLGTGKQVVAPPSLHYSAGVYRVTCQEPPAPWRDEYLPAGTRPETPRPVPPRHAAPRQDGLPPSVEAAIRDGANKGERNERGLWLACQLRDAGLPEAEAVAYIRQFAAACRPPLTEREALAPLRSAFKAPPRAPARDPSRPQHAPPPVFLSEAPPTAAPDTWGELAPLGALTEEPPAWPWEAVPPALRDMGQAVVRTMAVPEDMAGAAALGVASIALGNRAVVELKPDHRQFGNVYVMIAAPVGCGKTPAFRHLQAPLAEVQHELLEAYRPALQEYEGKRRVAEARCRALEKEAERGGERAPPEIEADITRIKSELGEPPPEPCLFCNDATSEALARRLAANGERIGVLSSEGRKVLAIARGCYRDHADIDLWLAGHGGDHIRIDRTNRPSIDLARPCISAVLACQPDALQSLGESAELRESGFLARWLYVVPESHAGAYPRESVTGPVRAVYERCIRGLLELAPGAYSDGTPAPQLVRLTPDAFDFWTKYHDAIRREMCALAESGPKGYVQWLGKLPEHVARLALLFHVVRHVSEGAALGTITAEAADAALVAECLKVHARRAFVLLCEDEEAAAARRVWTWLDKGRGRLRELRKSEGLGDVEGVKGRDVQRAGVAGLEDANKAGRVLDRLAERGYLQRCEWRNPAAPSRPHVVYFVRPASATGKVEGKAA